MKVDEASKASASVVVVGGGVIGCAVGLHLARAGVDVLVVDRNGIGQGASAAGAGFIGMWARNWAATFGAEHLEIERYGLAFYRELAEIRNDFGFMPNGNAFVATTPEARALFVDPILRAGASAGVRELTPDEVGECTGFVAPEAVCGAALDPNGGQVSAESVASALARHLVDAGGQVSSQLRVHRLVTRGDRVVGVATERGQIATEHVVLATAAWTNCLLRSHNLWLPIVPLVATRVVTENLGISPEAPTVMLGEVPMYARGADGALLWGMHYKSQPRFRYVDEDPPDRLDGLPLDGVDEMKRRAKDVLKAIPALGTSTTLTASFGAPTFTPDQRPLLGPVPGLRGLYVAAGCNEAGITHAPGYGRLLTDHILTSDATTLTSMPAFDPGRFAAQFRDGQSVVNALLRIRTDM